MQLASGESYTVNIPPNGETNCLQDSQGVCLNTLDQIESSSFITWDHTYQVQKKGVLNSNGEINFFKRSSFSATYDQPTGEKGLWTPLVVHGVNIIKLKIPQGFKDVNNKVDLFAVVLKGKVRLGDYQAASESFTSFFNKSFTDDVAKMIKKYEVTQ